jgi:hypothetical protein
MSLSIPKLVALMDEGWSICLRKGGPALLQRKDLSACPIALAKGQDTKLVGIWLKRKEVQS